MVISEKIGPIVESSGFDYAKLIGEWDGYDVYRLMLNDPNRRTGIPVMVLVGSDGECRFASFDETFVIMNAIYR